MDDGLPHPLRRWHLLPSPILDEYFCKETKFFVKIFLQVLLFPCNLRSLQPLCDTQEALGKYSRRTILSSKKLSLNSAFGEKNISLIKYSYKKNLAHSGLRSSSNSLIQDFAHPKTLSKHLVEVRNRRSQGSPKSWQSASTHRVGSGLSSEGILPAPMDFLAWIKYRGCWLADTWMSRLQPTSPLGSK